MPAWARPSKKPSRQLSREACSPYWEMPDLVGSGLAALFGGVGIGGTAAGGEAQGQSEGEDGGGQILQSFHGVLSNHIKSFIKGKVGMRPGKISCCAAIASYIISWRTLLSGQ